MHTPDWRRCVAELCRVSRRLVIVDYPSAAASRRSSRSARRVTHALGARTEPYRVFATATIAREFRRTAFASGRDHRQFVLPIALHKAIGSRAIHRRGRERCSSDSDCCALFGSPVTIVAERCASSSPARPGSRAAISRASLAARGHAASARWCAIRRARPASSRRPAIELVAGDLRDRSALAERRAGRRRRVPHRRDLSAGGRADRDVSRRQRHRRSAARRSRRRAPASAASCTAARSACTATSSIRRRTRTRRSGRATSIRRPSSKGSGCAGGRRAVRHRGDDCPAERHLRPGRSPAAEAVSRHRAPALSTLGPRRNLLPSHLHRRSGRRLSTLRRASGGGQPHLHPRRRGSDDAERARAARSPTSPACRRRRWHLPVWPFWLAGAACEAICAPLGIEPPHLPAARRLLHEEPRVRHHAGAHEIGYAPAGRTARRHHPHPATGTGAWLALTAQDQLFAPGKSSRAEVRGAGRRPPRARRAAEIRAHRHARAGARRRARPGAAEAAVSRAARIVRTQRRLRPERRAAPPAQDSHRQQRRHRRQLPDRREGRVQSRHPIGSGVFIGRNTILSCKNGDIEIADGVNIGFNCELFSASHVTIGERVLMAAYTYVIGGDHDFSDPTKAVLEQPRTSAGVTIGEGAWIGAGAKILDGVIDRRPRGHRRRRGRPRGRAASAIAVGVPARVVQTHAATPNRWPSSRSSPPARRRSKAAISSSRDRSCRRPRGRSRRAARRHADFGFGRQARPTSRTTARDVERRRPGDQPAVSELRGPAPPPRVLAESHDARVLRPVAAFLGVDLAGEPREGNASGGALTHRRSLAADAKRRRRCVAQSHTDRAPPRARLRRSRPTSCFRRRRQRPYRCDGYGDYIFAVSRLTPLKRLDLLIRALAEPGARARARRHRRRRREPRRARAACADARRLRSRDVSGTD